MNKVIKYILGATMVFSSTLGAVAQNSLSFDKEQYQKALWMTTRFYGAQRSGVGPNWLLAEHEPTGVPNALQSYLGNFKKGQSFVKDADGDYDLTGGWFDCGDHVKFGQTEFYSAYMLLLGYSEFPEGYDDYYSFDYKGYISSGDYTWEGKKGAPNGIPDILDEVKYATDYLMKCVRSSSVFYYQVGDGDLDHKHWVTASVMATLPNNEGGEAGGSRPVSKASGNVTSMAALCGSALAAMARL
ncbi:MAG: glycoside hydrolase family 9 protein, partial [Paludibacteraceae bacterium]|nr:glycoside hydrolase family 9 protein [Paludibacteraceae bacterium]